MTDIWFDDLMIWLCLVGNGGGNGNHDNVDDVVDVGPVVIANNPGFNPFQRIRNIPFGINGRRRLSCMARLETMETIYEDAE